MNVTDDPEGLFDLSLSRPSTPKKATGTPNKSCVTPKKATCTLKKSCVTPKKATGTPKKNCVTPKKATGTPKKSCVTPKKATGTPKKRCATPNKTTGSPKKTPKKSSATAETAGTSSKGKQKNQGLTKKQSKAVDVNTILNKKKKAGPGRPPVHVDKKAKAEALRVEFVTRACKRNHRSELKNRDIKEILLNNGCRKLELGAETIRKIFGINRDSSKRRVPTVAIVAAMERAVKAGAGSDRLLLSGTSATDSANRSRLEAAKIEVERLLTGMDNEEDRSRPSEKTGEDKEPIPDVDMDSDDVEMIVGDTASEGHDDEHSEQPDGVVVSRSEASDPLALPNQVTSFFKAADKTSKYNMSTTVLSHFAMLAHTASDNPEHMRRIISRAHEDICDTTWGCSMLHVPKDINIREAVDETTAWIKFHSK